MATERESSKFRLAYRGGKLQFGLDKLLTLLQRGKALSLSRELSRAGGRTCWKRVGASGCSDWMLASKYWIAVNGNRRSRIRNVSQMSQLDWRLIKFWLHLLVLPIPRRFRRPRFRPSKIEW